VADRATIGRPARPLTRPAAAIDSVPAFDPSRVGYLPPMTPESERSESDQLPEDAPPEQAPADDEEGGARGEAEQSSGVPNEQGQATGNPANAG
jgi:hypothetical protein